MFQNILIFFLLIIASTEGYLLTMKQVLLANVEGATSVFAGSPLPTKAPVIPRPEAFYRGMRFEGVFTKYTYRLYPGTMSDMTKDATTNYEITFRNLPGGTVAVTMYARDASGQDQQYLVPVGSTLYFFKIIPPEDNVYHYRDSYGIIVDQDGIIK